jgi:hypothetical protein
MRVDHIISAAISHLMGRMMRRAVAALALAVFAVVAVYHFTVAGLIALDGHIGTLDARLVVGGIYGALALTSLIILWAMGRKPAHNVAQAMPALGSPREMQLVMLVEAVMLGYALARKRERAS